MTNFFQCAGVERGHVDGVANLTCSQEISELFSYLDADIFLCFIGRSSEVGRESDMFLFSKKNGELLNLKLVLFADRGGGHSMKSFNIHQALIISICLECHQLP